MLTLLKSTTFASLPPRHLPKNGDCHCLRLTPLHSVLRVHSNGVSQGLRGPATLSERVQKTKAANPVWTRPAYRRGEKHAHVTSLWSCLMITHRFSWLLGLRQTPLKTERRLSSPLIISDGFHRRSLCSSTLWTWEDTPPTERKASPSFPPACQSCFLHANLLSMWIIPPTQCYANQITAVISYYNYFFILCTLHEKHSGVWSTHFFPFILPVRLVRIISFWVFRPLGSFVHLWAFISQSEDSFFFLLSEIAYDIIQQRLWNIIPHSKQWKFCCQTLWQATHSVVLPKPITPPLLLPKAHRCC